MEHDESVCDMAGGIGDCSSHLGGDNMYLWKWANDQVRMRILGYEQRKPGHHREKRDQRRSRDLEEVMRTKWTLEEARCSLH